MKTLQQIRDLYTPTLQELAAKRRQTPEEEEAEETLELEIPEEGG